MAVVLSGGRGFVGCGTVESATYTLRIVGGVTGVQFAAILGLVNQEDPPAELRWREHGLVCTFAADTWQPILRARVERALEAELGAGWQEQVVTDTGST